MHCPDREEILRQLRGETLDPWFTLHLLACEDCRLSFDFFQLFLDLVPAEPLSEYEPSSDPAEKLALDLMLAMLSTGPPLPDTQN